MTNLIGRRELLAAGIGLCAVGTGTALAQAPQPPREAGTDAAGRRIGGPGRGGMRQIPTRKAKTTKMFLTPPSWPNAIDIDHDQQRGFWVQEQKHIDEPEAAWLIDWNGKVLHTVKTRCANTSGMCYGGGFVWSGANGGSVVNHPTPAVYGIFQTDMNSKQISHRQIPFGPKDNGGATHGMSWQEDVGKIWIFANRLGAHIRIDPKTWEVDYLVRTVTPPGGWGRMHGIKYDNGSIWQVIGKQAPGTTGYDGYTPGLMRTDIKTGQVVEIVEFVPGSCDIHDLAINKGQLYGVDAGEHPGWSIDVPQYQHPGFPPLNSPSGGYVFRIDLI
jgi:hypothetical protein